jgi:hypothetical protein
MELLNLVAHATVEFIPASRFGALTCTFSTGNERFDFSIYCYSFSLKLRR